MKKLLCLVLFILFSTFVFAQEKKFLNLKRAQVAPKIDAVLDDQAWQDAEVADGFVQFRPAMGTPEEEHQKTIVKVTFDNNAISLLH